MKPFQKGSTLKGKNLLLWSKFFSSRVDSHREGGGGCKSENARVAFSKSAPINIKTAHAVMKINTFSLHLLKTEFFSKLIKVLKKLGHIK